MIPSPRMPQRTLISTSGALAQSVPQPREESRRNIVGLGVAFTAKYSRKPGFHAKARFSRSAQRRIPASS